MLVHKKHIKIILILIFVLVTYQISKVKPTNYPAYLLVAVGYYLIHNEMNLEKMTEDDPDCCGEENNNNSLDLVYNNSKLENAINNLNNSASNDSESNDSNQDELFKKANKLLADRENNLQQIRKELIKTDDSLKTELGNNPESDSNSCDCNTAIAKAISPLQTEISKLRQITNNEMTPDQAKLKTFNLLLEDLLDKGAINTDDVDILKSKMSSGLITVDDAISRLEKMRLASKKLNLKKTNPGNSNNNWWSEMNKSELPSDMYLNKGDEIPSDLNNDFSILNTSRWTVPMPRPPVCIDSRPKEIMPVGTSGYPTGLKYFDEARYVTTSASQEKRKKDLEITESNAIPKNSDDLVANITE